MQSTAKRTDLTALAVRKVFGEFVSDRKIAALEEELVANGWRPPPASDPRR